MRPRKGKSLIIAFVITLKKHIVKIKMNQQSA